MHQNPLRTNLSLSAFALTVSLLGAVVPATAQEGIEQGDAVAGEQAFKRCASCHKIGDEAKNAAGPILNELFGRIAGTVEGFRYGDDLVAAGEAGLVWDAEQIVEYIADPRAFLRTFLDDDTARARMSFKLRDEEDRWNVVAHLANFSTLEEEEDDVADTDDANSDDDDG